MMHHHPLFMPSFLIELNHILRMLMQILFRPSAEMIVYGEKICAYVEHVILLLDTGNSFCNFRTCNFL